MKTVKIGVIGCGGIANNKHMPAYAANKRAELVAFCDIVEERAIKANEKFGNENTKYYTDYKELLKDTSIDVVLVLTHNAEHCRITVDALEAGKHVLCEKPMAMNYAEAKKMIEARDKSGKILTIGYQNRFRNDAMYLKKLADEDTFGDIYYAEATALRRRGVPTWGVFIEEEKQGGGPLIDIGTHALDLTLWTMNNYKPKYCVGTTFHKLNNDKDQGNMWGNWDPEKFTVEDSAFGFVVMENGATINLESAWALNMIDVREATTLVCGTKAGGDLYDGVRINGIRNNSQYVLRPTLNPQGAAFYEGANAGDPSSVEAAQWIDAILNDTDPCVLPEQAYTVTRILEGIYESAKTGKPYYFD